ncbi:TPA: DGQHR domain-containing protein [Pseudomonas aeruginosa]|nr:DGQHR domain-containing protein [Pseudomonas aeruginosa]MDP5648355.1 DGQHR domain-containing protein [Pseudomonas aeruginosa]HEJ1761821.1 DGQHR domain-containing protein [Pseudomonas aeruginosa]
MTIKVPAIKVHQWNEEWDKVQWNADRHRSEPPKFFMVMSMKAVDLRRLSAIYRRASQSGTSRAEDLGIQRRHDKQRSQDIKEFVQFGYPYCDLKVSARESLEHESLRKPGWLPTGIVINILKPDDRRNDRSLSSQDQIIINENGNLAEISLPESYEGKEWAPHSIAPIEVIDGQHRLWAFEEEEANPDFEMPVIAFYGLDISWQAYLFWSINIKPVKINASLAFDMYPLLRAEDWLEKEGHKVYKEARAQELVETLWVHPTSPWKDKIDMLATPNNPYVRQASWIRTIISAFIKPIDLRKSSGGLFGEITNAKENVVPWTRAQQAAFLISIGRGLFDNLQNNGYSWAEPLNREVTPDLVDPTNNPAMFGKKTLLNSDQGIRALWLCVNDLFSCKIHEWRLLEWEPCEDIGDVTENAVTQEINNLQSQNIGTLIHSLTSSLASFDWRSSTADGLSEEERMIRKGFRGSGGYVELKRKLLEHIVTSSTNGEIADAAMTALKY